MFSDPMVAVMTMLLLFFAGMVFMFLSLSRGLAKLREDFREAVRRQQLFLSDVEQQMVQLNFALRPQQDPNATSGAGTKIRTDIPLLRQEDPLLSMLEAKGGAFDDHLIPSGARASGASPDDGSGLFGAPPAEGSGLAARRKKGY